MTLYTFHLYDAPETTKVFEIELFERVQDALSHARWLLRDRPRYSQVAITDAGVEVAQLSREAV